MKGDKKVTMSFVLMTLFLMLGVSVVVSTADFNLQKNSIEKIA